MLCRCSLPGEGTEGAKATPIREKYTCHLQVGYMLAVSEIDLLRPPDVICDFQDEKQGEITKYFTLS